MKPLAKKAYGSIPHLPGSRLGTGEYCITEGQAKIATECARDEYDRIIVQKKLDGSNVAVAKKEGKIIALNRAGYLASSSKYRQHIVFDAFVRMNEVRFSELLNEGERVCGEWLMQAHGTIYKLSHEPFVPFDIIRDDQRVLTDEVYARVRTYDFSPPNMVNDGKPMSIQAAMAALSESGHGAVDSVEGAIWRVERKGKVEFLAKYVKHDKIDGQYLPEITGHSEIWNMPLTPYAFS